MNIVTIICIVTLASQFANPIIAVAVGIVLGGLVQFLFQIPAFWRNGFSFFGQKGDERLTLRQALEHPGLRRIGTLIIPATFGMAVAQINIFVSTILASYLQDGSITYLYYSMRLIQFPIGIFGVAMGMAILPALSEHAAKKEFSLLKDDFSFALRLLFFITVPAMVGLIALQMPIVNTLFQRGEFSYGASVATARRLCTMRSAFGRLSGCARLRQHFYAMQDTKTR